MRVIISAGGTGGHIYPALSIINKIKEKEPDSTFLYIGTKDRMESKIIPNEGIPFLGINMQGLSKNPFKSIKSIALLIKSMGKIREEIKKFNPDIVIGVGGYITFPVIYNAKKLGIKTLIHEQNSIVGKTNRMLFKYADKIAVSLPSSLKYFKDKAILTGNPRSSEAIKAKPIKKEELGFSNNSKLVMIVMGSLGSMTISNELKEIIPKFKDKNYEVLLITGNNYYEEFKNFSLKNVKIVPFLNNMLQVLPICDLIITRAGASTIAEITAIGLPSILVPSPYVANNHQFYNAMELVNAKASLLLEEKDFKASNLLNDIDKVLNSPKLYQEMHEGALSLANTSSSDMIYRLILELVGKADGKDNK